MEVGGFGTGKSVLILTLVVGCFALLWPRIFFPMLQSSFSPEADVLTNEVSGTHPPSILPCCHPVSFSKERNALFFTELCRQLSWRADRRRADTASLHLPLEPRHDIWTPGLAGWCADELWRACGLRIDEPALERFRRAAADPPTRNLTGCLETTYGVRRAEVRPPRGLLPTASSSQQQGGRRSPVHPAMRDLPPAAQAHLQNMARQPKRVLDRMARPGPLPGSRPTPGGYGAVPQSTKGGSTMGIIMPIYTIGIVVFFVYTILKVMFKNPEPSESKEPIIPDYHMSTAYRPYNAGAGMSATDGAHRPVVVRRPASTTQGSPARPSAASAAAPTPTPTPAAPTPASARGEDAEIDQLRRRLEETERAMERIMKQMSTVSEKLNVAKISSNIRAIKQDDSEDGQPCDRLLPCDPESEEQEQEDLWGSTDSVMSDSLGSERSLSMESLAQTEASLASLEEDVDRAAQAAKKNASDKNGHAANGREARPAAPDGSGRRRVQELKT